MYCYFFCSFYVTSLSVREISEEDDADDSADDSEVESDGGEEPIRPDHSTDGERKLALADPITRSSEVDLILDPKEINTEREPSTHSRSSSRQPTGSHEPRGPPESQLHSRPLLTKSRSMLVPGSNVPQLGKSLPHQRAVQSRTLSWHEDSVQCVHCLRRIKREDVKTHSSTCELRTETCKYGCKARVLVIKMEKHFESCPNNPTMHHADDETGTTES